MTQVCHECSSGLQNPFYDVSLVLVDRANNRVAFADMSLTFCAEHYPLVSKELLDNPSEIKGDIGFAIDFSSGCVGGITGAVQHSTGIDRHMQYRFLDADRAKRLLPVSAQTLLRTKPTWTEYRNDGWQVAEWAQKIQTAMN